MALTIPYVFTAGTPAKATEVNSNFTAISNWANSNSFDTESFGILYPRVSALPSTPYYPILRLEQSSGNQALYIRNSGTGESIEIVQNAALGAGKSAILLTDSQTQAGIGCAELKMVLGANVDIPAIHITHNSVDIFKVNQNGVKPPVKTTVQRNAIVSPETGSILYDSTAEQVSVKRSDGWSPIGPPVGSLQMFAGSVAPEGWLLCGDVTLDSVANPKYAALFAVIGTTYGGTGAASFKLPDTRGRVPVGAGTGAGLTARTLAGTGGQENLENHTHDAGSIVAMQGRFGSTSISTRGLYVNTPSYLSNQGYDYLGANGITQSMTNGIATQGTSTSVNESRVDKNMQPYLVFNYIIKY
jgi:microcystin-dependent protein